MSCSKTVATVTPDQQKSLVGGDAVAEECQHAETRDGGRPVLSPSLQEKLGKLPGLFVSLVSRQTRGKSSTDKTKCKKSEN